METLRAYGQKAPNVAETSRNVCAARVSLVFKRTSTSWGRRLCCVNPANKDIA